MKLLLLLCFILFLFSAAAQKHFDQHFLLDYYRGLGIRLLSISTTNQEYSYGNDALIQPVDIPIAGIRNMNDGKAGKSFTGNFCRAYGFITGFKNIEYPAFKPKNNIP